MLPNRRPKVAAATPMVVPPTVLNSSYDTKVREMLN